MPRNYSFPKNKLKILLLEGVHPVATQLFGESGYEAIESRKESLGGKDLIEAISDVHLLGIRSKTVVSQEVLESAKNLLAVGCFCIGTNQVDLDCARRLGVPVFNAPFSNTRSVAELTLAEVVMLARRTFERSTEMHQGTWSKSAEGSYEVRNKTLGIIGYGHIGPQVGLLAEAFGMKVIFYDIAAKLPYGNAVQLGSMDELLKQSDFVTLHVPETAETRNMVAAPQLALMKPGAVLLNLSRGTIVDLKALKEALSSGRLGGAAIDVFPEEPASNKDPFGSELRGLKNVILTPHVGGSTVEAQRNIGLEVTTSLVKFTDTGSTSGTVNFPLIDLPVLKDSHRILNIHKNVPGVLGHINSVIAEVGVNISAQYLNTYLDVGYLIMDVGQDLSAEVKRRIDSMEANIRTRVLF